MANYERIASRKARKYGLNPRIFRRQIRQESGFQPHVVSPAGARGIAQIMPATARSWGVNPDNPRQALDAAARHMAQDVRRYGSYENALRAYNAGPGAIQASHGYAETNAYVRNILGGGSGRATGRERAAVVGVPAGAPEEMRERCALAGPTYSTSPARRRSTRPDTSRRNAGRWSPGCSNGPGAATRRCSGPACCRRRPPIRRTSAARGWSRRSRGARTPG
jgi:hypothetical protein